MKRLRLLCLVGLAVALAGGSPAQPPGGPAAGTDRVEMKLDRCTLSWRTGSGLDVRYNGQPVFAALPGELVVHTRDWKVGHYYSGGDHDLAQVTRTEKEQRLVVSHRSPGFRWQETLTAGPGDRLHVEYVYRQDGWDDASLQLGFSKPVENWFAGAAFETDAPRKRADGLVPLKYDPAQPHPFDGAKKVTFRSLFGAVEITTSKPVSLFDYENRNDAFWLGLDEPLPKGQELRFAIDLRFSPAEVKIPGVVLSDLALPVKIEAGRLAVSGSLRATEGGPQQVRVAVEATPAQGEPRRGQVDVTLPKGAAAPLTLSLPLPVPGKYTYRMSLSSLPQGTELFATPVLRVEVLPVLTVQPGRSLYTSETTGCLLLSVAESLAGKPLRVTATAPGMSEVAAAVRAGKRAKVPLDLAKLPDGATRVAAQLQDGDTVIAEAAATVRKAPPKANEVKIDYETRGLIVDGLPWFPFGFYAVYPSTGLAEQEAPQGFNMICSYQGEHRPDHFGEIKAYLDRCAAVGMKVHYDIRDLAQSEPSEAKWKALQQEIEAFRDHPALLTWYLCDEPDGQGIPPQRLTEAYNFIKKLDPYHPITMVFCVPPKAPDYVDGMDIMMADPYPIPNGPVTTVADWADRLNRAIGYGMPLWIVPQAFGGGEWWAREPSAREERAMTYLALVHQATGIQYFIRRAPIGNPTSPSLWSECRRLSLEVQELTPVLLSAEEAPRATCPLEKIHLMTRQSRGSVYAIVVNADSAPAPLSLLVEGGWSGEAEVLFEGRKVAVHGGKLEDLIDGFGTRVYRLPVTPPEEKVVANPKNLVINPSFESFGNVGTPDGCYVGVGKDPGASLFVDSRVAYHGSHSLRLCTPVDGGGVGIAAFPVQLQKGKTYIVSIWARGREAGLKFYLGLGDLDPGGQTSELTTEWKRYEFTGVSKSGARPSPGLSLTSAGSAWFDLLEVVPKE